MATAKNNNIAHHFNAALFPHRSLKPQHFSKLIIGLAFICLLASIRFIIIGAWPVVVFLALDLLALWFAFYLNYRRARACEFIKLTDRTLTIERISASGQTESWSFEPYWSSLKLIHDPHYENRLELSLHQQKVILGKFLSPKEREQLFKSLSEALYRWKNKPISSGRSEN